MTRLLLILMLLAAWGATAPTVTAQDRAERPVDLAAMPVPPQTLPEDGYQFARGGYLTLADARFLIEERYAIGEQAIGPVLGVSWRQGYTSTFVLLSDRTNRSSDPLASVTTAIHELESGDGATLLESLLVGAPPKGAENREAAVQGATTWRVVTSQEDSLVTVSRQDRFVIEVVSADRARTPVSSDHAAVVQQTLSRVAESERRLEISLSQQLVLVEDDRLIPVALPTESPLAHTWYRVIDGDVVLATGELGASAPRDLPLGLEEMVIARQTAEISSQNWVTVGVIVARFGSPSEASAVDGVMRDPLDEFAVSEDVSLIERSSPGIEIEAISGETRVGGRYSGYRITVVEGVTVAQLTIRAMGGSLIDRDATESWAQAQAACTAGDACDDIQLTALLAISRPSTPAVGEATVGSYASAVAPWSVSYDTELWQERDRFAEGGYDYLYLRSERMDATFETIVNHHGDPKQCVLDELDRLRADEDRAAITVGSDNDNERPGGLADGHAWVVYTVEPLEESRAGDEYTIRIDCYTVVEGSTSLVVQVRAPRDAWAEIAPIGESLRSQIRIDGVPVGGITGGPLSDALTTRSDVMINRRPWVGIAA